jgi:hypothetical protein
VFVREEDMNQESRNANSVNILALNARVDNNVSNVMLINSMS